MAFSWGTDPYRERQQPLFLSSLLGPVTTIAPPTGQIVDLKRAQKQCRVETDDDNDLLNDLIDEAAEFCSRYIYGGATLLTTTYTVPVRRWWAWGEELKLPYPPLQSVQSVTYEDPTGATQTLDPTTYEVLTPDRFPGAIRRAALTPTGGALLWYPMFAPLERWPITITFTAGFGDATQIPKMVRRAALLYIAEKYRNRGDAAADPNALKAAQDCLELAGYGSY